MESRGRFLVEKALAALNRNEINNTEHGLHTVETIENSNKLKSSVQVMQDVNTSITECTKELIESAVKEVVSSIVDKVVNDIQNDKAVEDEEHIEFKNNNVNNVVNSSISSIVSEENTPGCSFWQKVVSNSDNQLTLRLKKIETKNINPVFSDDSSSQADDTDEDPNYNSCSIGNSDSSSWCDDPCHTNKRKTISAKKRARNHDQQLSHSSNNEDENAINKKKLRLLRPIPQSGNGMQQR